MHVKTIKSLFLFIFIYCNSSWSVQRNWANWSNRLIQLLLCQYSSALEYLLR